MHKSYIFLVHVVMLWVDVGCCGVQDPPDKMMTHHKVEAGVLGRTGVLPSLTKEPPTEETTTTPLFEDTTPETETETGTGGGSSAMAGMVPHQKDFETEANFEAKGAETPDGPVEVSGPYRTYIDAACRS